jgi:hypothetical protein
MTEAVKIKRKVSVPHIFLALLTLAGGVFLSVWSMQEEASAGEVVDVQTNVVQSEDCRTEYLVGQTFDPSGFFLNIGTAEEPQLVNGADCQISADLSTAGRREVTFTYEASRYLNYIGTVDVSAYFVRSLTVERAPQEIVVGEDGTFSADEGFTIVAQLSGEVQTDVFTKGKEEKTIILSEAEYTTKAVASVTTDGYYAASLYCGNLTYAFNFYNDADRTFLVDSEKSIVKYQNESGGTEGLTLVVTSSPDSYQHTCTGISEGSYIYTSSDGKKDVYDFAYELTEREEIFRSDGAEAEERGDEGYSATFKGNRFVVSDNLWQSAVVGGSIYTDGEYKLVVDSDDRIIDRAVELKKSDGSVLGEGRLTLYVSYHTFDTSTGSGVSEGYYIFTDNEGKKYKFNFYMQTWTWDYVPLSAAGHQVTSYEGMSFVDYMEQKYAGPMHIFVSYGGEWIRGEGWKDAYSVDLVLTMDEVLKPVYNMK